MNDMASASAAPLHNGYMATIGIECHVQLKTATKLFSGANNDARDAAPNTLVNHIDFGLPGALPVLNREAVHLAARAAFALGTQPQRFSKFDRKHYFYPDLPLGYQITQYDEPIILGGLIGIEVEDQDGRLTAKTIGITRAHLEADAGKSTHPTGADYSLVDLNRAGTPLLEIVSEPDMHTAAEAKAYARELYLRMKYADVSDANLYYGNMRFDVNVSVSKELAALGTRTETKNINSFRAVEKVVEYEIKRQIEELENGGAVVQETRGWDDTKLVTFSQRTKEDAHDYRYFPDPDLPPVTLSEEYVDRVKSEMPVLPGEWRERLAGLGLGKPHIETLLDAEIEFPDELFLATIDGSLHDSELAKYTANTIVNIILPILRDSEAVSRFDRPTLYRGVHALLKANKMSSTNSKELIAVLLGTDMTTAEIDIEVFARDRGLVQDTDEDAILVIVDKVLADNPKAVEDVKNGETKVVGFLTGQVMKASQGKVNPALAGQLIRKQLGL